tara:strand:- start:1177 stop:1629 length:453 start_codon:yes stop_codon:yes gene_type:complete
MFKLILLNICGNDLLTYQPAYAVVSLDAAAASKIIIGMNEAQRIQEEGVNGVKFDGARVVAYCNFIIPVDSLDDQEACDRVSSNGATIMETEHFQEQTIDDQGSNLSVGFCQMECSHEDVSFRIFYKNLTTPVETGIIERKMIEDIALTL